MNKKNRLLLGVTIIIVLLGYLLLTSGTENQFEVSGAVAAKEKFMFNWNDVPGNGNVLLAGSLAKNYGIDWVKTAKIEKTDAGNTINLNNGKNSLSLRLNEAKTKVAITIDNSRTEELTARGDNGNLNIYRDTLGDKIIIVNGSVVLGTEKWDPLAKILTFKLTDGIATIDVIYTGDKPNMPPEATSIQAVVTGRFNNDRFEAFRMLTKCPSKYEGENSVIPGDKAK